MAWRSECLQILQACGIGLLFFICRVFVNPSRFPFFMLANFRHLVALALFFMCASFRESVAVHCLLSACSQAKKPIPSEQGPDFAAALLTRLSLSRQRRPDAQRLTWPPTKAVVFAMWPVVGRTITDR